MEANKPSGPGNYCLIETLHVSSVNCYLVVIGIL